MSSIEEKLKKVGLEMQPYWSTKYLKNVDKLSKPEYKVKKELDVYAAMPDGIKLCVDVFRPDVEGKRFPALLAWSSYGKRVQSHRRDPRPTGSLMLDHSVEVCDIDFMVTRGYAMVIPDPRGVGKSEGEWNGMYSPQEQKDLYDFIEWITQQPWCDGKVGMNGMSYFGYIQPLAAAQQPPHLKAIMPYGVCDDLYTRAYPGGMLYDDYHHFYLQNNPNNPVSESERMYAEEDLKQKIEERLRDPFVQSNTYYIRILNTWPPRYNTWFFDVLLHPLDGPFWHARSEKTIRDKIKIPTYLVTTDFRGYQIFNSFSDTKLNVPKKAFVIGRDLGCPYRFTVEETLRWYDHWLKGIDTGIMDEPPIKIFVHGANRYRFEYEWPLTRTRWIKFYLQRYKTLGTQLERDTDIQPDILAHEPSSARTLEDVPSINYSTEPLTKPVEVTGPLALYLYAAIDVEDANFIARLYDVSPTGEKKAVTGFRGGHLKASHRLLIKEKSKPWMPVHDHTKSIPVKPGVIYEYAIDMTVCSNVFQTGHRMVLEIKSMDPMTFTRRPRYTSCTTINIIPSPWVTTYKIYHGEKYPSHLLLPIISENPIELWFDQ